MHTISHASNNGQERQPTMTEALLDELRAIRREQLELRRLFDSFAGVFLNAKFPHGRATDRWARR